VSEQPNAMTMAADAVAAYEADAPKDQIAGPRWDDENK
jgi:hypothetical protein